MPVVLCSSLFRWCAGRGPVFPSVPEVFRVPVVSWSWPWSWSWSWSLWLFAHYHTHAHTYARARGFLDYKFLDITAIFRRIWIFIFFLPIGIFGTQTAIFRLQKHKFSIKK